MISNIRRLTYKFRAFRLSSSQVLSNTFSSITLRGLTAATRLVTLLVIARFANPTEFGAVIFALSATEIAKVVADFGVDMLAIRAFAMNRDRRELQRVASSVALAKFLCSMIAYLALIIFLSLSLTQGTHELIVGALTGLLIFTGLFANLTTDYFQARLQSKRIIVPVAINSAVAVTAIVLLSFVGLSVIKAISIVVIAEIINTLNLLRYFCKEVGFSKDGFQLHAARDLLRQATPIAATAILVVLYTRLDVIMLGNLQDKAAVGYYGTAYRLTEPFQLIASAFALSVYSHISTALADGRENTGALIKKYGVVILAFGTTCSLSLALIAPKFIEWFLPKYLPAIPVLQILSIALIFRGLNAYMTSVVQAHGQFKKITVIAAVNLSLIACMLLLFVPRFGVLGAAVALLIGEITNTLIQVIVVRHVQTTQQTWSRQELYECRR